MNTRTITGGEYRTMVNMVGRRLVDKGIWFSPLPPSNNEQSIELSPAYIGLTSEILKMTENNFEKKNRSECSVMVQLKIVGRQIFTLIRSTCSREEYNELCKEQRKADRYGIYYRCSWNDGMATIRIAEEAIRIA